jgi:two-component system, NarL family, nitrate/nitrite response regulator NarL
MRVLIVTEIRLYRDGVSDALRQLPDVDVVVSAATGPAAVLAAKRAACNVALLDMALKGSGAVIAALLAANPDVKVVALGIVEDSPEIVACAEAGVGGYVTREASLAEVGEALRSAVRGEAPVPGRVAAGLLKHIAMNASARRRFDQPAVPLTPREREIAQMMQSGMTNRQIARLLELQLSTVKNHVHNVLTKFGVESRADVQPIRV